MVHVCLALYVSWFVLFTCRCMHGNSGKKKKNESEGLIIAVWTSAIWVSKTPFSHFPSIDKGWRTAEPACGWHTWSAFAYKRIPRVECVKLRIDALGGKLGKFSWLNRMLSYVCVCVSCCDFFKNVNKFASFLIFPLTDKLTETFAPTYTLLHVCVLSHTHTHTCMHVHTSWTTD